ncbi:MAG: hypothetical protein DRJ03_01775 [Chloroflexi bacterium]|nr:MAG: hypothetical protein DRJ03_01775 [Chloroflexota bacterium]
MPLVIGRGYGRDDQVIVQRIIGDVISVLVRLHDVIETVVEQDESPFVQVSEADHLFTTVQLENTVACVVELTQTIFTVVSEEGDCMSTNDNSIRMFRGDNRDGDVTANWPDGVPVDFTGAKITLTFKDRAADADSLAIFQLKNTAAGGSDDEVFMSNPTGGQFDYHIVRTDTEGANPGMYVYDIQAVLSNGKVLTLVKDKFILKAGVTHEVP